MLIVCILWAAVYFWSLEVAAILRSRRDKIITGKGTGKILAALWLFQVFSRIVVLCRVSLLFSTFILSFFRFPFGGDLQLILSFCRCPLLIASLFN